MGYFENITDDQIVQISDEEINRVIDLECAKRGIPLWCTELEQPKCPVEPDMTLYHVAGHDFETIEDAEAVKAAIVRGRRWKRKYRHWGSNEVDEWEPEEIGVEIKVNKAFRPETWHKHRADLDQFNLRETEYKKIREQNEKAYTKRADVAREVWGEVSKARERLREDARLKGLFDRYIKLAGGDQSVARKFLIDAESFDDNWQIPSHWLPPLPVAA